MQWWTFARSKATLRANLSVNSPMECITRGYRWGEAGRSARHAQIPAPAPSPDTAPASPADTAPASPPTPHSPRTPRWHPAGGVPSAVSRLGLPGVKSHMSHRDKPVTIGPTSGLPARGYPTCSRWSSDSRQSIHFPVYSCGAAKVSLDFSDTAGSGSAQPRRPARTASQIRRPSSAPATMACEQWPSQRATPSATPCRMPRGRRGRPAHPGLRARPPAPRPQSGRGPWPSGRTLQGPGDRAVGLGRTGAHGRSPRAPRPRRPRWGRPGPRAAPRQPPRGARGPPRVRGQARGPRTRRTPPPPAGAARAARAGQPRSGAQRPPCAAGPAPAAAP